MQPSQGPMTAHRILAGVLPEHRAGLLDLLMLSLSGYNAPMFLVMSLVAFSYMNQNN